MKQHIVILTLLAFMLNAKAIVVSPEKKKSLYEDLVGKKPPIDLFEKAYLGFIELKLNGQLSPTKQILTIVDFRLSSKEKRMWVVDIKNKQVLHNTYVAHGENSGKEFALSFSNKVDSHKSSLGFYITEETYIGKNGLSLRLKGIERKFNSNARDRYIVIHGADYATEEYISENGVLGNSEGCPAVPMGEHVPIIELTKGGTLLFLFFPDENYMDASQFIMGVY